MLEWTKVEWHSSGKPSEPGDYLVTIDDGTGKRLVAVCEYVPIYGWGDYSADIIKAWVPFPSPSEMN